MIILPLTQGYEAIIDEVDDWAAHFKWHVKVCSDIPYANRAVKIDGKWTHLMLHRLVYEEMTGETLARDDLIDIVDGNPLNARRENLRPATRSQDCANRRIGRANTTGFKGVTRCRQTGRWKAQITVRGLPLFLGRYDSDLEAAKIYNDAAKEHFKEFARLNTIPERL